MEKEEWKSITNYEGLYEVSSLGNVKSLGNNKTKKEKVLKPRLNRCGYYQVYLSKLNVPSTFNIHQLVAVAFLNHKPCGHKLVVDHINNNKTDNREDNLQIVTQRFNTCKIKVNYTSEFKGVSWHKRSNKWTSRISLDNKSIHLGMFDCELKASLAYQNKLKTL
jgi:hypothetical protein